LQYIQISGAKAASNHSNLLLSVRQLPLICSKLAGRKVQNKVGKGSPSTSLSIKDNDTSVSLQLQTSQESAQLAEKLAKRTKTIKEYERQHKRRKEKQS